MIFRHSYTARLVTSSGSYPLNVIDGSVTLNEASAPYVYASLTVSRPSMPVLDRMAPETANRVVVSALVGGQVSRQFDLLISARQLDTKGARVGLNLVSDEQLLQDYSLTATTPDTTFWGYQSSASSIVYNVLNRVLGPGFALSYEATNKPVPTYSALQNLIPVPSFEVPSGVWIATNVALARSTNFNAVGTASLQITSNTTSNDSYASLNPGMQAGKTYSFSGWFAGTVTQPTSVSSNARRMAVYVQNGSAPMRLLAVSNQGTNGNAVTRLFSTFTIPENTTYSEVRVYNGAPSGGGSVYWDALMLTEGTGWETNNITRLAYFDGDTIDTATYAYDWDDVAGLSSSRRTPLVERSPDFLTWSPGQSAWDFLTPILQAVGMRLFCDETRTWRIVDNEYWRRFVVHLDQGVNLYEHSDLMSRTAEQTDGLPLFADAVVIKYTWTDDQLREQVRWDKAGPANPVKAYFIERRDTAYPGPGTASHLLSRLSARRRQLSVSARPDYSVTPGQEVSISAPMAATQTGYIDAVSWDFNSRAMTVVTKGLISIPANAIGRAPSTQTIGSVSTDLASYTN